MTAKELNLKLIAAFPELTRAYREQTDWQEGDDTGSHVVYGDVLVPAMLAFLKSDNCHSMKKYFDFLETLLLTGDEYAVDVVATTVIESIAYDDNADENKIKPLLGVETLKIWESYKK